MGLLDPQWCPHHGMDPSKAYNTGALFKKEQGIEFFRASLYFVIKQILPSCHLSSVGGYCLYLRIQHFFLGKESHWNSFFFSLLKWSCKSLFPKRLWLLCLWFYKVIAFKGCSTESTYFYVFYFSSYDDKKYMNVRVEVGRFSMHWICVMAFNISC